MQHRETMHTALKRFCELNAPVMMVLTDLQRFEKVVYKSGNLLHCPAGHQERAETFRAQTHLSGPTTVGRFEHDGF